MGRPVVDDHRLFEKLSVEGFQSGLSWLTILRKREGFRQAFARFDPAEVARFDASDVERLLADPAIVRHRAKIESTVNNARRVLEVIEERGSFAAFVWSFEPDEPIGSSGGAPPLPSTTPEAKAFATDLKRRGFTWVGPTTAYAFMQAMGMVNDHLPGCHAHRVVAAERASLTRPR